MSRPKIAAATAAAALVAFALSCAGPNSFDRELARRDLESHSAAPQPSEGEARELVRTARDLAAAASLTLDSAQIDEALKSLAEAARTLPDDGWIEYHAAYLSYVRMTRALYAPGVSDRDAEFERSVAPAVAHAEAALVNGSDESEAAALLAAIDGLRIGHNSWLGMSLGPQADELVERALHADPDNPRAWVVRGTSLLFKPAMFGGDKDAALRAFEHAADLFERAPPPAGDSLAPTWGRAEAQAWIGQALRALGRDQEAFAPYRRALEIAPDFGWVRDHLLPSLERKMATR